jgi:hypothetical protein
LTTRPGAESTPIRGLLPLSLPLRGGVVKGAAGEAGHEWPAGHECEADTSGRPALEEPGGQGGLASDLSEEPPDGEAVISDC